MKSRFGDQGAMYAYFGSFFAFVSFSCSVGFVLFGSNILMEGVSLTRTVYLLFLSIMR